MAKVLLRLNGRISWVVELMKTEQINDIWNKWNQGFWIVIPTNKFTRKNGTAVMGRGLAWQAKEKFPKLEAEFGKLLINYKDYNVFGFPEYRLFAFTVKNVWWEKAELSLIEKSCKELETIIHYNFPNIPKPIYVPKVGCGNGKLNWEDVKPILEKYLDDKFIICDSECR